MEIFQLQNENEDLRDRLGVIEETQGGTDVQKLINEKRNLEKRVHQLEITSNNWMSQRNKGPPTFAKKSMTLGLQQSE